MTTPSKLPTQLLANPASPAEILKEYFGDAPLEVVASVLGVSTYTAHDVLNNLRAPNYTMCLRLAYYFDTSFEFWMGIANSYTLYRLAQKESEIQQDIDKFKKNWGSNETN